MLKGCLFVRDSSSIDDPITYLSVKILQPSVSITHILKCVTVIKGSVVPCKGRDKVVMPSDHIHQDNTSMVVVLMNGVFRSMCGAVFTWGVFSMTLCSRYSKYKWLLNPPTHSLSVLVRFSLCFLMFLCPFINKL